MLSKIFRPCSEEAQKAVWFTLHFGFIVVALATSLWFYEKAFDNNNVELTQIKPNESPMKVLFYLKFVFLKFIQ